MAVKRNQLDVIETLIEMEFPLEAPKHNGINALGIAAYKGNLPLLQGLHDYGLDINTVTKKGITPLNLAIKSGNMPCIKYLIDNGANPIIKELQSNELQPLFQCIKHGNLEALKLIYDKIGGTLNLDTLKTSHGFTAFTYSGYCKQPHILNYLSLRVKDLN